MSSMLNDLVGFANPPSNVVGSATFLTYIAFALYASVVITASLWQQFHHGFPKINNGKEHNGSTRERDTRKRRLRIFASLGLLSFATLSYHMLMFLIRSYMSWSERNHAFAMPPTIASLKDWMWQTSLFESFGRELLRDEPSVLWTQVAILETFVWNVWMAEHVKHRGYNARKMMPFMMLSQILPVSFVVCLFAVQLQLAGSSDEAVPGSETRTSRALEPKANQVDSAASTTTTISPLDATLQEDKLSPILPLLVLIIVIAFLPGQTYSPIFMILILLTRYLLYLPHTHPFAKIKHVPRSLVVSWSFIAVRLAMLVAAGWGRMDLVGGVWNGGQAVKALGWDAVIGAGVGSVIWIMEDTPSLDGP